MDKTVDENSLQNSEGLLDRNAIKDRLLAVVFDSISDEVIFIEPGTFRVIAANKAFLDKSGTTREGVSGRKCYELTHGLSSPCGQSGIPCPIETTIATGSRTSCEHVHVGHGGAERRVEISTSPVADAEGNILYVVHISKDVTELRRLESEKRGKDDKKDAVLKEIHHRIKNNMQFISSLLRLQSEYVTDEHYIGLFRESQGRIKSLSMIHERMLENEDASRIDFREYIKNLAASALASYRARTPHVRLNLNVDPVSFDVDTAIPCGLLINELLSNSLKHAFPQGMQGEIHISLKKSGSGEYELSVRDTGVGLPKDIDPRSSDTLGLRLISTLAEGQLEGRLSMKTGNGTEARIRFKGLDYSS